eukprot:15237192-Alexandrium_andersonii.AAC.1
MPMLGLKEAPGVVGAVRQLRAAKSLRQPWKAALCLGMLAGAPGAAAEREDAMALAIPSAVEAPYRRMLLGAVIVLVAALVLTTCIIYKKMSRTLRILDYKLDW